VLSIDDTLADPRWRHSIDWPNARNITIRMLLAHTSGIPNYSDSKAFERRLLDPKWDPTPRQVIAFARRLPPDFAPGKGWQYSNTGYQILGLIIEAATGRSYAYELQHRIFGPLGLKHTYLYGYQRGPAPQSSYFLWCQGVPLPKPSSPPRVKRAREAACHNSKRPVYRSMAHYYANDEHKLAWSDGGIVSTPADMTKWMSKLIASNQVLDATHRAMMRRATPQSVRALANAEQPIVRMHWKGYGLGLQIFRYGAGPAYGHGGNIEGFSSNAVYLPGHGNNYAIEMIAPLIEADTAFDSSNRIAAAVAGRSATEHDKAL
jgi:D-alanyl-D-alanine carboxypeptidase